MGFGCTGLTGICNEAPVPEELGISIIKYAFAKGITFFDTSDVCGPHTNEVLIGKVSLLPNGIFQGGSSHKNIQCWILWCGVTC